MHTENIKQHWEKYGKFIIIVLIQNVILMYTIIQ